MNVSLTPELDQYVNNKVSTGRYSSASEVVREALRLMETRDAQLLAFQQELDRRLAGLDAGHGIENKEARQILEKRIEPLRKKRR